VTGLRSGLVLVGAGSSERMQGIDKVWQTVAGKPLFMHSLERFLPLVDVVVLVVRDDRVARARSVLRSASPIRVVSGGASRQESVWKGICALPDLDIVAVHDVARPLAPAELLREGVELAGSEDCQGAIPSLPVADTIKLVDAGGRVRQTVDRSRLAAAQTPQVFRAESLIAAHAAARRQGVVATDDAALLEERGDRIIAFAGTPENFKVTTELDLQFAEYLLSAAVTG
jgi:2-C-methyl-D-erythritol 4-phosphate cytidylyltransferase